MIRAVLSLLGLVLAMACADPTALAGVESDPCVFGGFSLAALNGDPSFQFNQYSYYVSVCAPINATSLCGGRTGAAVCQSWTSGSRALGLLASSSVLVQQTAMVVSFGGNAGDCPTASLVLTCNPDVPTVHWSAVSVSNCSYLIYGQTRALCSNVGGPPPPPHARAEPPPPAHAHTVPAPPTAPPPPPAPPVADSASRPFVALSRTIFGVALAGLVILIALAFALGIVVGVFCVHRLPSRAVYKAIDEPSLNGDSVLF